MKNDLISRQVAIDKLETVGYDFSNAGLSEIELEEVCEAVGDVRQDMISMIKRLPSVQPEMIREIRKWINSGNRGNADYFIVEKIEEIINKYE